MSAMDIKDTVGAFVPGGLFRVDGAPGGPLAGLTFAAKDLFDVAGRPTGAGNPDWLATHPVPERSSPIVDALLAAGATLVGKVLTDEMAFSLHGDNMHYGAPINARAPDRVTGGSSNGSAAAAAAGLVDFALGTDTGGSTRVPASYCGLWGLRPTHGLLPSEGLVPLHPSFDTPTWLAADPATFLKVADVLLPAADYRPTRVLRVTDAFANADPLFTEPANAVFAALADAIGPAQDVTVNDGAGFDAWRMAYATSGAYEGWAIHGEWIRRCNPVFAPAIAGRWQAASEVTAEAAAAAREVCARIRAHVRAIMQSDCVAVLPSAAGLAPLRTADAATVDALRMRTMAVTCIAGIAGLPQVSMPFTAPDGAPLGISLVGPAGSDRALVRLAVAIHAAAVRM